jgi:probable rRNA maturation factor
MILSLVDRRRDPEPPAEAALCAEWALLCRLAGELGPAPWRVDLVLVDDSEMTGLNAGYRGAEGPTDVLSFSYLTNADPGAGAPGAGAGARGARLDLWPDPLEAGDGPEPLVGEVVLAPGFITTRCREQGWAPDQEMALLVVHGCLHILGWEHDDDADRTAMMAVETAVLRGCGLPHPLAKGA